MTLQRRKLSDLSRLPFNQWRSRFNLGQPGGSHGIPPPHQAADALEITLQISGEDRLVMGNAIPEQTNLLQIIPAGNSGIAYADVGNISGKRSRKMVLPDGLMEPRRQHFLPEFEFQIHNDLARSAAGLCTVLQIALCIAAWPFRQGTDESFRSRPVGAMNRCNCIGNSVSNRDFTRMQGSHECRRDFQVPPVRLLGGFAAVPACPADGMQTGAPRRHPEDCSVRPVSANHALTAHRTVPIFRASLENDGAGPPLSTKIKARRNSAGLCCS